MAILYYIYGTKNVQFLLKLENKAQYVVLIPNLENNNVFN
jgi:hypothetical protein